MGKGSSPPPAPDYTAAAKAQGAANVDTARVQARLSNPNIISPYGNQTVSYGQPVFDQAGYDKAMAAWNAQPATPPPQTFNQWGSQPQTLYGGVPNPSYIPPTVGQAVRGPAPTREQFTSNPTADTPTIVQTLSPENQKLLAAQQGVQLGLADTSKKALKTVQDVMGRPFDYNGPPIQTSLGTPGTLQDTVANAGTINRGPAANQYGLARGLAGNAYGSAGGGPAGNAYGSAGASGADQYGLATRNLNLANVARMPVNAGMTGQNALMSRLQPTIERERQQYETQLRNQGLVPGGEAYNNAMTIQNQRENDLLNQAALYGINLDLGANQQGYNQALQSGQFGNQAVGQNFTQGLQSQEQRNRAIGQNFGQGQLAQQLQNQAIAQNFGQGLAGQGLTNQAIAQNFGQGQSAAALQNAAQQQQYGQNLTNANLFNQAQNQRFNQGLASAEFGNTAQQQALQQQLYQRELPLNEITALMSGSQVSNPQFPQYRGAGVEAPPLFNATANQYNAGLQGYGMQNNADNAFTTGLMGLAGATASQWGPWLAAAISDRRLKTNVERIGTHPLGIGIYEYDIFGQREQGVMADEVLAVQPEAVIQHPSGFFMVDYGRLYA